MPNMYSKERIVLASHKKRIDYTGYLYILPAFLFILAFSVIPIIMTSFYSLNKFNIIQPMKYIGLNNYSKLFRDPFVTASIRNTIIYVAIVVPLQTILALLIAALITSRRKNNSWTGFVKSSLFIPVISSMVLIGTLWKMMYNPQVGFINQFLSLFEIPPVNWLGSKNLALFSVCIVSIWKDVGYFLVIYIAAIMDIPITLYEAGRVDGASWIKQFIYITLPMLKPITFLVVTLGTIWSFQVFDLVYIMTGGGPGTATVTLVSTIYNVAFREYSMGYACSIAMFLFLIIIVISLVQKLTLSDGRKEM